MRTEAQKRADKKYRPKEKENIRTLRVDLRLSTDLDIIDKLDSIENKAGYVKALIRADIERSNNTVDVQT